MQKVDTKPEGELQPQDGAVSPQERAKIVKAMVNEVENLEGAVQAAASKRSVGEIGRCLSNDGFLDHGAFVSSLIELEGNLHTAALSLGKEKVLWETEEVREAWRQYVVRATECSDSRVALSVLCHGAHNLSDRGATLLGLPTPHRMNELLPAFELSGELFWVNDRGGWWPGEACVVRAVQRPGRPGKPRRVVLLFLSKERMQVDLKQCVPFTGLNCWLPPNTETTKKLPRAAVQVLISLRAQRSLHWVGRQQSWLELGWSGSE